MDVCEVTDGVRSRRWSALSALVILLATLSGCATRDVFPPLPRVDAKEGYRAETRPDGVVLPDTDILLALSGGGTRAAALAFGVMEELRATKVRVGDQETDLLHQVRFVSGVSGGSFPALAYALQGDAFFERFPHEFLYRDVQGELLRRLVSPLRWPALWSDQYGRSELAAELYDELIFKGATFGDLAGRPGPLVMAAATDLSTGARVGFTQVDFDALCVDLSKVRLALAAASSSAVPVVLSPITLDNHAGNCGYDFPAWVDRVQRAGAKEKFGRIAYRYEELRSWQDQKDRPYLHLVDGGLSDNLGLRAILERLQQRELMAASGPPAPGKHKRLAVIVVNARSDPSVDWDRRPSSPSSLGILLKSLNVPIDRFSYESIELMREMADGSRSVNTGTNGDQDEFYAVDVNFANWPDLTERRALMDTPTSFSLSPEQVDLVRRAGRKLLVASPSWQAFLHDLAATSKTEAPLSSDRRSQ